MSKPRIYFATIAAGGSHVSSAQAMQQAINTYYPDAFDSDIHEPFIEFGFTKLDDRHKASWQRALDNPWSVIWGQRIIDSMPAVTVAFHRWFLNEFSKTAAARFNADPPDLIISNHGWLTIALTQSQRKYGLKVPVLTFQTSTFDASALWADPQAERYMLGSKHAKQRLVDMGVSADIIDVVGYPVKQAFLQNRSKQETRAQLGLKDTFTCLVSLGGEGTGGNAHEIIDTLTPLNADIQIIIIAGRNERLKASLETHAKNNPLVKITGFINNMADYVTASDVIIGKTGPAAVFESLAIGRPFIAPRKSGQIENVLIDFLEQQQLGHYTPKPHDLKQAVLNYYNTPTALELVRERTAAYDFPGMARQVAAYIAFYARHGKPDVSLCGPGLS